MWQSYGTVTCTSRRGRAVIEDDSRSRQEWFTVRMDELVKFAPKPTGVGEMFQLLRDGQPRTRADLATVTGQSRSTIAARVDLLLASGYIAPAGEASSTGGRPPATFAFNPAARVVLAGDLNAVSRSASYRLLVRRLRDAQVEAGGKPGATFPSRLPLLRIDHIFIGAGIAARKTFVHDTPLARRASDHLPLCADLEIE